MCSTSITTSTGHRIKSLDWSLKVTWWNNALETVSSRDYLPQWITFVTYVQWITFVTDVRSRYYEGKFYDTILSLLRLVHFTHWILMQLQFWKSLTSCQWLECDQVLTRTPGDQQHPTSCQWLECDQILSGTSGDCLSEWAQYVTRSWLDSSSQWL